MTPTPEQIEAAREDSRRLDWLEGQARLSTSDNNGIVRCWEIRDERPDCVGAYREMRTVIDAAIASGKIDTP